MSLVENFFTKLRGVFKIPELRDRIGFTLLMFLVARVGTYIPAPGVNTEKLQQIISNSSGLSYINMFSGGALIKASIFALGIVPYINASIVFSLLAVIIPKIEEIQREGESGRNKITQWTRYLTIALAVVQGIGVCAWLRSLQLVETPGISFFVITTTILTAGTVFLMWVGEQISVKGIGNGVSLIIFLNIISGAPAAVIQTIQRMKGNRFLIPILLMVGLAAVLTIAGIVVFQLGQRKIPVHYVGKGFAGSNGMDKNSYIPLRLNSSGVMPVIFASVIMMIPSVVVNRLPSTFAWKTTLVRIFSNTGGDVNVIYMALYALVIIFFSFFYTSVVFDPEKVAENLKQGGGTIPSIRPGSETADYLEKVVTRITWGGAIFLALIAIAPMAIFTACGLPVFFGGTGIIIVVGVALDTVQQIDAHLIMKEYKGFL